MGYFTSYQISQKNATLYVTCCIWHSVPLSLFLKKLFLPYMSPNTLRSRFSQSVFSGKKCWVKFGAVMDFPQYSIFYFVSEAPKFENLFFCVCFLITLLKSSDFNELDYISGHNCIMNSLFIKYDMMIFFSGFLSGFRIFRIFPGFPRFFQIFRI